MATTPVVSAYDGGSRLTVADLIGNPLWIPTKLKERMENVFISEALLRNAGGNTNGLVGYYTGDPTFLEGDIQDIAEFGEIPVSSGRRGAPQVAVAVKRGLGVRISREMRDENNMMAVTTQMNQLVNTFIRADDRVAKALLTSNAVPTLAVADAWDTTDGDPRKDIANGIEQIATAKPDVASDEEWYGFQPDTMVVNGALLPSLLSNDKFNKVYQGNLADQNIAYTGAFPGEIFGLSIIRSRSFPVNKVLLLERGTVGFYSDTRPREFTGMYPEGNGPNGGPTESWRCDATHKRAIALDQPKAALWLTGVTS